MILATIIEIITEILETIKGRRFQGRVQELPYGFVLKTSTAWGPKEADIIRFVQRHTAIPSPRILASDECYGRRYLLMKKVEGENLQRVWSSLEPAQRTRIVEQLRSFIAQLRSLSSPHGPAICSLNGSELRDSRLTGAGPVGPFVNEDAFNERLLETTAVYDRSVTLPGSEIRSRMRGDHDIVFTHGDIAPRNIIVEGDVIVALLDWEQAGWYPEHWELVKAMWCPPVPKSSGDLWMEAVKDMFDKNYEAEWQVECDLSRHIVGPF